MSSDRNERGVETELDRDIGIVGAVALGVGTMIAAGIFVLSGLAVSNVGAMAIVAFAAAAVVASFTAFAYAEFSAIYPESGGGYAYVANTFDTDLTYIVGWSMILGYPASAAFYLASFSGWFYSFIYPLLNIPQAVPFWLSGVLVLALLVGVNLKGTEESGQFQIVVTALKVALILLFLYGGLQAFDAQTISESFVQNADEFGQIAATSALVFITFFGFEAIATNAEEIENPGTNVPRAIFISMGFVTVVYTLVVLVIVLAVNNPEFLQFLAQYASLEGLTPTEYIATHGEVSMAYAARFFLDFAGGLGFYVIIVGALFSMLSAANATILAGSRVKLAMSRRDQLPDRFERLHDSLNTPYWSVLLTGGLIFVYILLFTVIFGGGPESSASLHLPMTIPAVGDSLHLGIDAIAHFADFMLLTGLIVVNVAIVQSRRKFPDMDRPFEVPGVPVVPAIAVLANFVLVVNVEPSSLLLGLVAEVIGVGVWFGIVQRTTPEEREEEAPTVVEERHPKRRDYQLLVPIANPENVEPLLRTAYDIAADKNGEILVMSVVSIPEQTPLSEGTQYVDEQREVVSKAMDFVEGLESAGPVEVSPADEVDDEEAASTDESAVPVSGTVRIAHHVDNAILHTVEQYDSDAVLMGWSGRHATHRRDIVLGSVVDSVAQHAPCDVLVERVGPATQSGGPVESVESILLPTAGGPHAEYAAEVARAVCHTTGASVELFRVDTGDGKRSAEDVFAGAAAELEDVEVTQTVVEDDDVVGAIVERSADHDLTIIGATREGLLQQLVFGAVPEAVGRRAENTVIMAKRNLDITSWLQRVFAWR